MYVRICQEVLKIPLKNEIPDAGQIRREKRLYRKFPAGTAVKDGF